MTVPWLLLALALAVSAATPAPPASPTPGVAPDAVLTPMPSLEPTASPSPSALPGTTPSATPSVIPSAIPSQWPTRPPLPAMNYQTVPKPAASVDPAQPAIIEIDLNEKVLTGVIAIRVITSAAVVKVTSSSNGHSGDLPQVGPGEFEAISKLPKLPFTFSTTILFIATSADGRKASVKVPVKIK